MQIDDARTQDPNDDAVLPPAGKRSGAGSQSVLPYLLESLAVKPKAPSSPQRPDPHQRSHADWDEA